jgi:riboflavin biosynthesis pyrimidine reductase
VSAELIDQKIETLYGADVSAVGGVIHVASVWSDPKGVLHNLLINDSTPLSLLDEFVLSLARMRADAIVTTGRILRLEPEMTHAPDEDEAEDLLEWRATRAERDEPPLSVVLSRGEDIDLEHPVLHSWSRPMIYTQYAGARALDVAARARGIELVGEADPSLASLLTYLRAARGCETIVIEAGPSTTAALYVAPGQVDELMLSVCRSPWIDEAARGAPFVTRALLTSAGLALVSELSSEEESGPWSFQRYRRRELDADVSPA